MPNDLQELLQSPVHLPQPSAGGMVETFLKDITRVVELNSVTMDCAMDEMII